MFLRFVGIFSWFLASPLLILPPPPSAETRDGTAGAEHDNNQKNDSKHKNKMLRDI